MLEIGGEVFRFDVRPFESDEWSGVEPAAAAPETTEHRLSYSSLPHLTAKMRMAASLNEPTSWKRRLRTWVSRYGISELAGIATAFGGSWLLSSVTGEPIATAYGAAVGEAIGFYGSLTTRALIHEAYFAGSRRQPFGIREVMLTWRGLFLEFGPAELLDTGLLRPLAMGIGIGTLGPGIGVVAGKILADITFYLPVIWMYEHRRKAKSG
jgi:hypothetical protein